MWWIDLTRRAIEDFVSSLHKHSVGRVILAFKNMVLGKAQSAIEACEAWLSTKIIPTSICQAGFLPTWHALDARL